MNAINWLISKSELKIEAVNDSDRFFSGNLPSRMIADLHSYLKAQNATRRDGGSRVYYNWEVDGMSYSLSFGAYNSTANKVQFGMIKE